MLPSSSDLPKGSLQIKQEDKFYSRLLSKESSVANLSFRVYYGVAPGAVPFLWESQPGTPKHTSSSDDLPPLTPPPSYFYSPRNNSSKKPSKFSFIHTMLPKLSLRTVHMSPSSSISSSSSSSASSSSSSGSRRSNHRRRSSSPLSYFSSGGGDHEESDDGSPTSTLCFGMRRRAAGLLRGRRPIMPVKDALLSIVGHGSGQGTAA